jgi:hypothetical protein
MIPIDDGSRSGYKQGGNGDFFKYVNVLIYTITGLISHVTKVPYFAVQVLNFLQCCFSAVTELVQNRSAPDYLNDFMMMFCYPASQYMSKSSPEYLYTRNNSV